MVTISRKSITYEVIILINGNKKNLSKVAGIFDEKLEKEFYEYEISSSINYVKPLLLLFASIFLMCGIADYFILNDMNIFRKILYVREAIVTLILVLIFRMEKIKNYNSLKFWFTLYEVVFCSSYLYILYLYGYGDYLIHCFEVILIIVGVFAIPNKWINSLMVSIGFIITFFILSFNMLEHMPPKNIVASYLYIFIALLFMGMHTYRISSYKRIQYLNEKILSKLSFMDQLTEICNRFKFHQEYERLFNYYKSNEENLAIIMFDIDDFKRINDNYGHIVGDSVLKEVTKVVKVFIRGDDVFARWGGEEFVILLSGVGSRQAINITKRIKDGIRKHNFLKVGTVTCSFGLALPLPNEDMDGLLNRVDEYLYNAKNNGKNQIVFNSSNET